MFLPQSGGYIPLLNISLNIAFRYGNILVKIPFSISIQLDEV